MPTWGRQAMQRSFDSRSLATLLRGSLRMTNKYGRRQQSPAQDHKQGYAAASSLALARGKKFDERVHGENSLMRPLRRQAMQRSFDLRSVATLLGASLRMTNNEVVKSLGGIPGFFHLPGLKPRVGEYGERGAKAPLFHGGAGGIRSFDSRSVATLPRASLRMTNK
jgi:hypothetical protein